MELTRVTKREFIGRVVDKVEGLTLKDAAVITDAVAETICDVMAEGCKVNLGKLGEFGTKVMPGRTGVHNFGDKKGQTWTTEPKNIPVFKPSTALKELVK